MDCDPLADYTFVRAGLRTDPKAIDGAIINFKIFILQKSPNIKLLKFLILLNKSFLMLTCHIKESPLSLCCVSSKVDKCCHLLAKGLRDSFHTTANSCLRQHQSIADNVVERSSSVKPQRKKKGIDRWDGIRSVGWSRLNSKRL